MYRGWEQQTRKILFNMKNITMQYATKSHLLLSLADEQGGLEPACTGQQKPMVGISSQLGVHVIILGA